MLKGLVIEKRGELFRSDISFSHYLASYVPFWRENKAVSKLDRRIKEDLVGFLKKKMESFEEKCKMIFIDLGLDKLDTNFFNAEKILLDDSKKNKKKLNLPFEPNAQLEDAMKNLEELVE